jgi:hypothetical protein
LHAHRFAFRHGRRSRQALRLPEQASFTGKFVEPQKRDNGFLSILGQDSNFDLSLLDVENEVRIIALSKNNLFL